MMIAMWNPYRFLQLAYSLHLLTCLLFSQPAEQTAELDTAETRIVVEAGVDAPRLLSLQVPGQPKWRNRSSEALITSIESADQTTPVHWRFDRTASHTDANNVTFVYESETPRLRLTWLWIAKQRYGPIEHQIRIENLTEHELWIPMQDCFAFDWELEPLVRVKHVYVEKGANTPSPVGTHEVGVSEGYRWTGLSTSYGNIDESKPREVIPWSLVQREDASQSGWYVGIEFSGRTRISLEREKDSLHGKAGLNPDPASFQTRLASGESFESPVVFVGGFDHGPEGAGNILRRWVRAVLGHPETWKNPNYPLVVNNSWGGGMAVNHGKAARGATGPSLITSDRVLTDEHGEQLVSFLRKGIPEKGMPAFGTMSDQQLTDITEFLHLQVEEVANRGTYKVLNILVGNAPKGKAYVEAHCMSCHTAETFAHIASKFRSPEQLQRNWIWPAHDAEITANVKRSGEMIAGRVTRISDFRITLVDRSGETHTIDRGPVVEVQIKDQLAAHQEMVMTLANDDMHNVTAYLVTLK